MSHVIYLRVCYHVTYLGSVITQFSNNKMLLDMDNSLARYNECVCVCSSEA